MTVEQGLKRIIIKKSVILSIIAIVLGAMCYYTSSHETLPNYNNMHLIYTLISIVLSLIILVFIAWKMRFFHNLFAKEWTGTVIRAESSSFNTRVKNSVRSINDFVLVVKVDGEEKPKKFVFSANKISSKIYVAGDRIHRLKGTRYPINLTREVEQHICPICGFNSIYGDECPECRVKY